MPDGSELIYAPAVSGAETYLIALAGQTGSGKTLSALRLARGLAGPDGKIFFADTENGRGRRYAGQFEFQHCSIHAPFLSEKYTIAAEQAQKQGAAVLILDSVSHEHVGPGGVLERMEDELNRLAGDPDARGYWDRRERVKGTAWIKPKRAHKAMLQRFIQLNMHVICCLRAEPKLIIRPKKDEPKKTEWVDGGLQPVCGGDFMFDMTMSFMLYPLDPLRHPDIDPRGYPVPVKLDEQDRHLIPLDRPLDEAVGAAIAAKARGEAAAPPPKSTVRTQPESTQQLRGEAKNRAKADELIARFDATKVPADHDAIIAEDQVQDALRWFTEKRPELAKAVSAALNASWKRCNPPIDKDQQRVIDILADIEAATTESELKAATGGIALETLAKRLLQERPELARQINEAEKAKLEQLRSVPA